MNVNYIVKVGTAVERLHGFGARYLRTVHLREVFEGQIVWDGEVEVFELLSHPEARECYAWSFTDEDGKEHYTSVLDIPPVVSPETAVRAVFLAKGGEKKNGFSYLAASSVGKNF
jgi:hypothetical protein